jgi:thiosulfate/3-mercaptopyruvate sulfurtransferase
MRTSPLITAEELPLLLATAADVVLLDARPGRANYAAGHLADARHADLDTQLSAAGSDDFDPARGGRHPLPPLDRWRAQLGAWGIGPATHVIVYDDQSGANAATRAWWMLRAIGHNAVSLLDGGFAAGVSAGVNVDSALPEIEVREPYPADAWNRPTVNLADVESSRRDRDWKVLDVRSHVRFVGESEPIDPIAGHIPGAVNLPFSDNLRDGLYKPQDELREQYETLLNGTAPERLIVHCGSGVTACHTLFALDLAGLTGASLYVGSWSEWCRNETARATGD